MKNNQRQELLKWVKGIYFLYLGGSYQYLETPRWYLQNRLNTIVMRSHEHGFVNYFDSISKRTFKQTTTRAELNTVVSDTGGLQEILVSCGIYFVGMLCAIFIFILEYFTKRNSQ